MFLKLLVKIVKFLRLFNRNLPKMKVVLKNIKKDLTAALPSIEITEKTIIGRSVETKIDNPNVSRNQLMLKPNFEDKYLLVKFVGKSPSAINGYVLQPNEVYEAKQSDIIEVLYNTIFYEVNFEDLEDPKKRRSEEMMETEGKKPKVSGAATENRWDVVDGNKLYIFTAAGVKASPKVAAYDMDNTLIKTVSGNVFPKSIDDWQLNYSFIPKKLEQLHKDGFKIIIFTNQAGIGKGQTDINDFKKKIESIVSRIGVPVQVFVATHRGKYRKPITGMWEVLEEQKNDNIPIDKNLSFYIGDAAGRGENKIIKKKKDHSMADRLFALNLGLSFYTPEENFLKEPKVKWNPPDFDPKNIDPDTNILEPETAKLKSKDLEVVLMVGFPASGKSHFAREYLGKEGYEVISRDQLKLWQKCVSKMESCVKEKKSCVIDNTNPDVASRKKFIDVAKKLMVPIRAFVMNSTHTHSKHNNAFRELTDPSHETISDMVFNIYKSKYEEPKITEGFSEIVKVNMVPKFKDANHQRLYNMFLLEK